MGWLNKLFKKEEPLLFPADLSSLVCDVHSHLIPGIDDGSPDMETSLQLIATFKSLGYKKLITTPHVMSDYYRNTSEIIQNGLSDLKAEMQKAELEMEIEAAAEYYLDENFDQKVTNREVLTFGDNYLLFELSFMNESILLDRTIFNMQTHGYKPVLAHPERYAFWHDDLKRLRDIRNKGVILQLNLNSLSGVYSPNIKKMAENLIDEGLIEMVGSDCHRLDHLLTLREMTSRQPYLHKLLKLNLLNPSL